jgi:hypothetical protein
MLLYKSNKPILNSVKGNSNQSERLKRAADGGNAVPEAVVNGPWRRYSKIKVAITR